MKPRNVLLLTLLLMTSAAAIAQTTGSSFQIRGQVLDSLSREGEPYATIKITKRQNPTKPVKMLVTDTNGNFKEKIAGVGDFVMLITSMGRNSIVKSFSVKAGEEEVNFGTLYITDNAKELQGVEVVAQKPLVKADIDKIEYNVQDDPDAQSNSVLEMLRKVPLVTVDGEDKIQVNGSSSFRVYVNGKPNNMMSNNPTEVLKSMPANSIKHIEVITNPGPKYDAEGVGGILNIVTVGSGMQGYMLTLRGNVSTTGAGGGLFGTVQKGKLTVSGRYNYNAGYGPRSYRGGYQDQEPKEETPTHMEYSGSSKSTSSFQSGSIEASYEIDTVQLVSLSFGLWGGGNDGNTVSDYYNINSRNPSSFYKYANRSTSKSSWYSIDGGIDYQLTSRTVKDRLFTLSYKINTRPQTSDSYSEKSHIENTPEWQSSIDKLTDEHNDGSQNTTEHTFQADYSTPIHKIHTLEGGLKYILRNNISEDYRYLRDDANSAYDQRDDERSSHYKHLNDILSAYAGYALRVKKISARAGLRYERTMQHVKYLLGAGENFKKNFNDVVPSASLGYKITDFSNLRLGYNMRIYRPGIWALNPYINNTIPSYVSRGNPELESEKSHSFNLAYSNFTPKFNLNVSANYAFTNNSIESVISLVDESDIPGFPEDQMTHEKVLYTTYDNIGKSRRFNLSGYANWNISGTTRLYVNLYGGYSYLEGAVGQRNDGWMMFVYGGFQQTFKYDWRLSLNVMHQTPSVMLQGKSSVYTDYSMSLNKTFLKKRLTLSAFAGNFLGKYQRFSSSFSGADFAQGSWSRMVRQRFGFSVSYRIGELKASVKKAARTISNDDVKGGGGEEGTSTTTN
ncbi:MAG: TonB-dependent receptor family protein [Prevotellaceae bacterium]|nr:TonB-dependent receptor family protein [Prevotellaceae bacterium]